MRMILCAFAPAVVVAAAAQAALAATIRVPEDAATIQAAVDQAQAGDEIVVRKGKYKENVAIVGRANLTLRGAGATIDGTKGDPCLSVDGSSGIVVTGFAFRNAGRAGVLVVDSSDVEVSDGRVLGTYTGPGIVVQRCTNVRVLRNQISKTSTDGIRIGGFFLDSDTSDDCLVEGNSIKKTEIWGILVRGSRNTVRGNTITAADSWSIVLGDDEGAGDDNVVASNVIKKSGFGGVRIRGNRATCSDNQVLKAGFHAFWAENGVGHVLTGNLAKSPEDDGFQIDEEASNCTLRNNQALKADDGFNVRGTGNLLEDNESVKARSWGFVVTGTGNTLRRNVSTTSKDDDFVDLAPPGSNTYEDNVFGGP